MRPHTIGTLAASSLKQVRYYFARNFGSGYGAVTVTTGEKSTYIGAYSTTRRMNPDGSHAWSRSQGGYGVAVDSSENVYVAGGRNFIKYNKDGTVVWTKQLPSTVTIYGLDVISDGSGVFGAGSIDVGGTAYAYAVRLSSTGNVTWDYRLTSASAYANCAYSPTSGLLYASGTLNGSPVNMYLAALSGSNGALQWQRTVSYAGSSIYASSPAVDSSGNVYVAGYAQSTPYKNLLIKFNSSGSWQWDRAITVSPTSGLGYATPAVDGSDNVYVSDYDAVFSKFSSSGSLLLQRSVVDSATSWYGLLRCSANSDNVLTVMGITAFKVPGDGSLTGTYGTVTYSATTLTVTNNACGYGAASAGITAVGLTTSDNATAPTAVSLTPDISYIG